MIIKEYPVAARYAEAFIAYAKETIGIERAVEEIKALRRMGRENLNLRAFFENPEIPLAGKYEVIDAVLGSDFSEETKQFIKLLIQNKRIFHFMDIAEYIRGKYAYQGEQEAVLKTAYPLDLEVIERIKDKLENRFGKKVKLFIELDSHLLGGVQLVVGNKIIDGSIRRQLENLKENLMAARIS